jgi:hypothetical protein
MESTELIKNKAGFGNIAASLSSAFRGRARVRSPLKPRRQHLLLRFGTSFSGENVVNTNQKMKEQSWNRQSGAPPKGSCRKLIADS